jgi:hypothetical protein
MEESAVAMCEKEQLGIRVPKNVGSPVSTVKKKPAGIPVKPTSSLRFLKI